MNSADVKEINRSARGFARGPSPVPHRALRAILDKLALPPPRPEPLPAPKPIGEPSLVLAEGARPRTRSCLGGRSLKVVTGGAARSGVDEGSPRASPLAREGTYSSASLGRASPAPG